MINKQQASIAPDFKVNDSEGRALRLSDYRSKKNVLLVFNRRFT
jgi:peroxiredoxin